MKNHGQALLGVLATASVMAVVTMGLMSMFSWQSKASRKIAAKGGITDLSHALDTLFGSPACASSGSYLSADAPAVVSVSGTAYSLSLDTINFASGDIAITTRPSPTISAMIQPFTIVASGASPPGIKMIPLGGAGASGGGFRFPFKMSVAFASAGGPPPLPLTKFVTVYTNDSTPPQVVGACYTGTRLPQCMTAGIVKEGSGKANSYFGVPTEFSSSDSSLVRDDVFVFGLPAASVDAYIRCKPSFFMMSCGGFVSSDSNNGVWMGSIQTPPNSGPTHVPPVAANSCSTDAASYYASAYVNLHATCCAY